MLCESISGSAMCSPARGWRRGDVAVRFATFEELRDVTPARDSEWLTEAEQAEFSRLRHPARRASWRSGRLLAKSLLRDTIPGVEALDEIEILSRDPRGRSVRPEMRIGGDRVPRCLSIAHSDRAALVAVSLAAETIVGVDLVQPGAVHPGFLETWFTERERSWLRSEPSELVALCWGLKEAVYKACQRGEGFAPRQIEISPRGPRGILPSAACLLNEPLDAFAEQLAVEYRGVDLGPQASVACRRLAGHLAITVTLKTH